MTRRMAIRLLLPVTALVCFGLTIAPALAQNEPVRIVNRTGIQATDLYISRSGQARWGPNLLNRGPLANGAFLSLRLGEGAGCSFDLRLVLRDGREILRQGVDVCATRSVDIAPDAIPPAAPPAPAPLPKATGPDDALPAPDESTPRP
jgi:hypothetical protein